MTNKVLQLRRGSTVDHSTFTGAVGELTVDTTAKVLKLHDGETVGGLAIAKANLSNISLSAPLNVNSQRITNLANPSGAQDAATKAYVDSEVGDLQNQIDALGGGSSSITDEIDAIETSVGLESDGTKTNFATSLVTPSASFKTAIEELDGELSETNVIVSGKAPQALVDQMIVSSGLEETGHYEADINANYISAATSLKQADSLLDAQLKSEVDRAVAAEGVLTTDLASEVTRAQAAEAVLQGNIDVEKGRIDAILLGADADLNTFTEIVALINSIDTTNDGALATEIQARIDGDNNEAQARQNADALLQGNIDAEQTARENADSTLQGNIDAEETARMNADDALDSRLDVLEGAGAGSVAKAQQDAQTYADGLVSAESLLRSSADDALDARLDQLEVDVPALQSDLATLTGRVNTAESDIDSLQSLVASKAESVDLLALDGRVVAAETDIDNLESSVSSQGASLTSLQTEVDNIENTIGVMIDSDGLFVQPANTRHYIDVATSVTNAIELLDTALNTVEEALNSVSTNITEDAQDAVNALLVNGTHTGISFDYNDEENKLSASVSISGFALAELSDVSDIVANANDVLRYDNGSWVASSSLSTLESTVSSQASDLTSLQGQIDTEKGRIDAILLASDADKDSFAEIVALINSVDSTNDTAFATFASNVDTSMGGASVGVKANFTSTNYVLADDSYNAAVNKLDAQVKLNADDISALDTRLDTAESSITSIEGNVSTLQTDLSNLDGRVTSNEGNISSLQSDVLSAQGSITTLQGDVGTLQGDVLALDGRLDTAESNISSLQSDMTTAQGNISTLQSSLSTAEGDIDALEVRMTSAESNISTLQTDLNSLESIAITDVQGTTDEISVSVVNNVATIGLPQDVTITRNLTVDNNIVSTGGNVTVSDGNLTVTAGDVTVGGNIIVVGSLTSSQAVFTSLSAKFKDPLVSFGYDNASATADLGFYVKDSSAKYQGLVSDTSDSGKWKLLKNLSTDPSNANTLDLTGAQFADVQFGEVTSSSFKNNNIASKTADYTLQSSESIVFTDNSYNATLPSASTVGAGKRYEIKVTHSGNKTITLIPSGGQTIDGASTHATITGEKAAVQVMSDGSNWYIMSALGVVTYL